MPVPSTCFILMSHVLLLQFKRHFDTEEKSRKSTKGVKAVEGATGEDKKVRHNMPLLFADAIQLHGEKHGWNKRLEVARSTSKDLTYEEFLLTMLPGLFPSGTIQVTMIVSIANG
jgi:hypothetical protein